MHIYKKEDDNAREMEIFFPKDHDPATKAVPGIIMFHGGGWGGGPWGGGPWGGPWGGYGYPAYGAYPYAVAPAPAAPAASSAEK